MAHSTCTASTPSPLSRLADQILLGASSPSSTKGRRHSTRPEIPHRPGLASPTSTFSQNWDGEFAQFAAGPSRDTAPACLTDEGSCQARDRVHEPILRLPTLSSYVSGGAGDSDEEGGEEYSAAWSNEALTAAYLRSSPPAHCEQKQKQTIRARTAGTTWAAEFVARVDSIADAEAAFWEARGGKGGWNWRGLFCGAGDVGRGEGRDGEGEKGRERLALLLGHFR
ncbi:uncharacterized protein EV422DRAFT_565686 [Fimicolochytrium jonesii]|uniref:uncharacterized protein n=1 Tax=Fimicolochytrium jonesii TaxID=1396493 RepID=UPI0022FEA8D1|nr:uncharacterized protein EV422DRAFT_565686 [Fimicolochytrium jonesii]KAI8823771.1 hypothetical protein EV422DRAFT_565686 [Fimicolochytrium jonesii]